MSETGMTPETEVENRRMLTTKVVVEINKPNNYEGFKSSVVEMFAAFGIPHTEDPLMKDADEQRLRITYDGWQKVPLMYADIQIHGSSMPENPNLIPYANINIKRMRIGTQAIPVDLVCPGACSLPNNRPSANTEYSGRVTADFYRRFEQEIGIDNMTITDPEMKTRVEGIRNGEDNFLFVVTNGKSLRVPVNDWTVKLVDMLGK